MVSCEPRTSYTLDDYQQYISHLDKARSAGDTGTFNISPSSTHVSDELISKNTNLARLNDQVFKDEPEVTPNEHTIEMLLADAYTLNSHIRSLLTSKAPIYIIVGYIQELASIGQDLEKYNLRNAFSSVEKTPAKQQTHTEADYLLALEALDNSALLIEYDACAWAAE